MRAGGKRFERLRSPFSSVSSAAGVDGGELNLTGTAVLYDESREGVGSCLSLVIPVKSLLHLLGVLLVQGILWMFFMMF